MLKVAAIFLLVGIAAMVLGFTTIAGMSLFVFFMLLALALFATRTV